jgi:hypothetical protein
MNQDNNIISQWAGAHVFYNMYLHKPARRNFKIGLDEYLWRQKIVTETPNGRLITQNSFFESLKQSDRVYLAHITYNLDEILRNRRIFSSGGCLAGSIYCTPLSVNGDKLRMHNLGVYVAETEAPMMANNKHDKKQPEILIFEVKTDEDAHHNLIGIDYLRMGEVHYSIYKQLEYLLSYEERSELHKTIISNMKQSLDYLSLCSESYYSGELLDPDYFLNIFIGNIQFLPILGYLYFEAISEYLMLFQDNDEAKRYMEVGELYNQTYKELMYALQPELKQNFKLSGFQPSTDELLEYLKSKRIFVKFDSKQFKDWLTRRLIYLTNARLFDENNKNNIEWRRFHWDFNNIAEYARPLLGHLIHRELRNFGRYPSFYFYFDQTKALQVWNYWNHMDIEIPFNGVMPKGEVGINPALPHLTYKVFRGKYISDHSGFKYVEPAKELDISIEPKLVDLRYSSMHSKHNRNVIIGSDVD